MTRNEAGWERGARVAIGFGLLSLTVVGPQTPWGLVGLVPLFTAIFRFCPAYLPIGLNTCTLKKD